MNKSLIMEYKKIRAENGSTAVGALHWARAQLKIQDLQLEHYWHYDSFTSVECGLPDDWDIKIKVSYDDCHEMPWSWADGWGMVELINGYGVDYLEGEYSGKIVLKEPNRRNYGCVYDYQNAVRKARKEYRTICCG